MIVATETPIASKSLIPAEAPGRPATASMSPTDSFARRHIGPGPEESQAMLEALGFTDLEALIDTAVPKAIRLLHPLRLPAARAEQQVLAGLREIAAQNQVFRSFIGMGYSGCFT